MRRFSGILLIVASIALLIASIFFAIAFSVDTESLINPASVVMPIMLAVIVGIGAVLLLTASIKYIKGRPAKKYFIFAACLFALALVLFPITKAINQQMIINTFR